MAAQVDVSVVIPTRNGGPRFLRVLEQLSAQRTTLAVEHRLSIYDAAYLELALRKKLPLGCKDGPLREAAKRCHLKSL